MKKPTKPQIAAMREIMQAGGAIASGDWIRGSGRHVTKRPVPPLFREVWATEAGCLRGFAKQAANRLLRKRPRVKRLIVPADVRAVNKLLKGPPLPVFASVDAYAAHLFGRGEA